MTATIKTCVTCKKRAKWLPQCDECEEHFCHDHLTPMDGGALLCAACVEYNGGSGSEGKP